MTRIIGGAAKGRRLLVPDRGTRPTSDRAREALFNSLAGLLDLEGACVLDLFAGTGALGLEALSRGAAQAIFVESNREAAVTLERNARALGLPGAAIRRTSVEAFLASAPSQPAPFDLVFADPPYLVADAALAEILALLALDDGWLASQAVIVLERPSRGSAPPWPNVIEAIKHKRYGESALWYGRRRTDRQMTETLSEDQGGPDE